MFRNYLWVEVIHAVHPLSTYISRWTLGHFSFFFSLKHLSLGELESDFLSWHIQLLQEHAT